MLSAVYYVAVLGLSSRRALREAAAATRVHLCATALAFRFV